MIVILFMLFKYIIKVKYFQEKCLLKNINNIIKRIMESLFYSLHFSIIINITIYSLKLF